MEAEHVLVLVHLTGLHRSFQGIVDASADSNADDENDPEGSTIAFEHSQLKALICQAEQQRLQVEGLDELAAAKGADPPLSEWTNRYKMEAVVRSTGESTGTAWIVSAFLTPKKIPAVIVGPVRTVRFLTKVGMTARSGAANKQGPIHESVSPYCLWHPRRAADRERRDEKARGRSTQTLTPSHCGCLIVEWCKQLSVRRPMTSSRVHCMR
jgi:hypothetical protein